MGEDIRFGLTDGARFSQHWKVAPTAGRPELVISGSRTGAFLHLTLHEEPQHSAIRINTWAGKADRPWVLPEPVRPGVHRLIQLLMPTESVRFEAPRRSGKVAWVRAPANQSRWTEFTVLLCPLGIPTVVNAELIGSTRMLDGTGIAVIWRYRAGEEGLLTGVFDDPTTVDRLQRTADRGMLISGARPDGCLWFLQLYDRPRDA